MSDPERWKLLEQAGERLAKLAKLRQEGLSMEVIAQRMGVGRSALYRMLDAAEYLVDRRKLKSNHAAQGARTE